MRLRPLILAAPLAIAAPVVVAAQQAAPPAGFVQAAEVVGRYAVQTGLQIARSFVELTYEDITVDLTEGVVAVTGLKIRPPAEFGPPPECVIHLDAIEIAAETVRDFGRARIELIGLEAPMDCVPPEPAAMLAGMGYERVRAEALSIDYDYDAGSSALNATILGALENAIEVQAAVEFSYLWLQTPPETFDAGPGDVDPIPVADLSFLEIALTNKGALERGGPMIEAMIGGLEAAPMIVEGGLMDMLAGETGPSEAAAKFASEAGAAVEGFLMRGEKLVISVNPDQPVRLNEDMFEDPATMIAALSPSASGASASTGAIVDPTILAAIATGAADTLSDADRLAAGRAFATGEGAPRGRALAMSALAPLVAKGDAEAAMLSAGAALRDEPAKAYEFALIAAAGGAPGAVGLLDRIERRLSFAQAAAAQRAAPVDPSVDETLKAAVTAADIAAIRDWALAAAKGDGRARHVEEAYGAAVLAAAAGDRSAKALADRLDRRYSRRDGGREWSEALDAAAVTFMGLYWIDAGLGATLMAR